MPTPQSYYVHDIREFEENYTFAGAQNIRTESASVSFVSDTCGVRYHKNKSDSRHKCVYMCRYDMLGFYNCDNAKAQKAALLCAGSCGVYSIEYSVL